ncbi:Uncharacterized protein GBIM_02347 [Gryllus bimaculatus]|nr:Uncharacterized protein GBIM_02347 [Gryllus bimaculatus]
MRAALGAAWRWALLVSLVGVIDGEAGCRFPAHWAGSWFQSGVQLVRINASHIETKGECLQAAGDKFLIEDKSENCFRCVVIHEKHANVLQYKETYCDEKKSLDDLCSLITGDATLFSMLRLDPPAGPVACPFKGPFTFTYNRGSGECWSPVSRIDSCTDESRLLLRYQACPDGVHYSVEELVCLATWKEGSTRYLIGKVFHKMATSDEDRYRCFVYDHKQSNGRSMFEVAQSGDATCNGLLSPTEGSRTMKLTKVENSKSRCRYPNWVTEHHQWHTLDLSRSYHFSHKNATLRISHSGPEMRVICHNATESHHQVTIVAHTTSGCNSGYVCMRFYKRDGHVIELQQSNNTVQVAEEACNPEYFPHTTLPYTTLITATLHPRKCPYLGRYTVTGLHENVPQQLHHHKRKKRAIVRSKRQDESNTEPDCDVENFESLSVGCTETLDTMDFYSCNSEAVSAYSCHGNWEENGTSFLIASPVSRKSTGARRYCFIYTHGGNKGDGSILYNDAKWKRDTTLQVSTATESCHRNITPGISGHRVFNLTMIG